MILVDSSYFIALMREKDMWHNDAVEISDKIKDPYLVSDLIISESVTMVSSLEGGKAGKLLYEYFIDNCKIEFVDSVMLSRSMEILLKYDGSISLADAVSVEIMNKHRIRKIISFDSDFDKIEGIVRIH